MKETNLRHEAEPLLAALGKVVKERRKALGISQEELAAKSGLHRTYVSDVERGIRNLTVGAMCFLANGLGLSLTELVGFVETRVSQKSGASGTQNMPITIG